jgi:hypothetical protein
MNIKMKIRTAVELIFENIATHARKIAIINWPKISIFLTGTNLDSNGAKNAPTTLANEMSITPKLTLKPD